MKTTRLAIGTILLASVAAVTMPLTAEAFRGGGGGGHVGGGGGGHIGGGGMHFGGGHFGGGHFGGGHFGGGHFGGGGFRMGGGHFGGFRTGGFRSGGFSHHAFSAPGRGLNHSLANRAAHGGHPFATRTAGSFSHRAFFRDGFHGFHRFGVFGWVGPLFWPYAFSDIYCDIFWGYWGYGCADPYWSAAYGDPFWDYGYGDIYGGLFSPFAFADLAPYLPNGPSSVRVARSKGAAPANAIAQMCGDDTKEVAGWPIDRIQQLISPDDQQRKALDDLSDASVKAAQIIKSGCPTSVAFTPTGRLAAMQQRVEAMEQAVETVRGPLDAFYGSLTEEQKAKFNVASEPVSAPQKNRRQREAAQTCTAANAQTQWPEGRIESALHPTEEQQAKLKALQTATAQAAEQLAAACPSEMPATPPARLAAVAKRLDVMRAAVKNVRSALDDLYADLSDEQKAQFNQLGQSRSAERQG
jgi:LTXXQ motif family protein